MKFLADFIIPTYDNPKQLLETVNSMMYSTASGTYGLYRIIVVNNGSLKIDDIFKNYEFVKVLTAGKNLGWERGLKLGLSESDSPFVVFANDDIRLISGQKEWFYRLFSMFNDPKVGAVGPCSNCVRGKQNIFYDDPSRFISVKYLIGFFMAVRRKALDEAGGVDDTLPGGDDLDLGIRLRDCGYSLICMRDFFVYHHGSQTGNRVFKDYWNSTDMIHRTHIALIKKHGMRKFWDSFVLQGSNDYYLGSYSSADKEGDICRRYVNGDKRVFELGCGGVKTVENAVGVDILKQGMRVPFTDFNRSECVSDIHCDVSKNLTFKDADVIIARHILEHCQDSVGTLCLWNRGLRKGGKLIIAVPNQELGNTIIMNPEHVVSFTPSSLWNLANVCGFCHVATHVDVNGVSFVCVLEKCSEAPECIISSNAHPLASRLEELQCA